MQACAKQIRRQILFVLDVQLFRAPPRRIGSCSKNARRSPIIYWPVWDSHHLDRSRWAVIFLMSVARAKGSWSVNFLHAHRIACPRVS
jgi:hypothetical protein